MRCKFLIILLLLPTFAFGICWNCSKYRPCIDCPRCCHARTLAGWWMDAEYMLIWRKSRFIPPLVTTNVLGGLPILGAPGTEVLFGDESKRRSPRSGARADAGLWVTTCIGAGAGGWGVNDEKITFFEEGIAGAPILGRPFFDVGGVPSVFLISFPAPTFSGSVDITAKNSVWGGDAYIRYRLLCSRLLKFDLLGGYMTTRIGDSIVIDSTTTNALLLTTVLHDSFSVKNTLHAGLLGLYAEARTQNWALVFTGKAGLGNMVENADVDGFTKINDPMLGIIEFPGGLLALPTNMGKHGKHFFTAVTQLSLQVQLRIWWHLWLTAGYTYMHWPRIALAGDLIDLNINSSQLFGGALVGPPLPAFVFHETNFFIHGGTVGFYLFY